MMPEEQTAWPATFAVLLEDWRALSASDSVDVAEWQQRFAAMRAEHDRLRRQGRWDRGRLT